MGANDFEQAVHDSGGLLQSGLCLYQRLLPTGTGLPDLLAEPCHQSYRREPVALGLELLYRSTTGGGGCSVNNQPCTQYSDCPSGQICVGGNSMRYGRGVNGFHGDTNDVTFASNGLALFIGTDGSVWESPNFVN